MSQSILNTINSPADVKKLDSAQANELCEEIRQTLITTTSRNGGHLAPNLGVVELTVALHRVFDSPLDEIVFDVGHQCYTHKLLTGRREQFDTLRCKDGLSGFPKPCESEHDPVICGHSSTSISAVCGLARAKTLSGDKHHVIAVIGDGALTGGLAYEGLNNAGRCSDRVIIILNDNKMSISKNVGAMARYLAKIRSKSSYVNFKNTTARIVGAIPLVGKRLRGMLFRSKAMLKHAIYGSTLFENMGFAYLGPINGHDLPLLEQTLTTAKSLKRPVFIHVCTRKGKGYPPAERHPRTFHGIGQFDIDTGEAKPSCETYSDVFGKTMIELAREDEDICAITAAMKYGTGLDEFAVNWPERFYDCGIAEEHAVTFSAGLSAEGKKPVFAVYSSFIQRAYDQIIHDVAIGELNVTLAIDRAGIVGEDGETHQGLFDCAMLNTVPKLEIYCPATFYELRETLRRAVTAPGAAAVRYPRGGETVLPEGCGKCADDYELIGEREGDVLLVTYGRLSGEVIAARSRLLRSGVRASVLRLMRVKPIDDECARAASSFGLVCFFEEGIKQGGIAQTFGAMLFENDFDGRYRIRAVDNVFVKHASVAQCLSELGLDCAGIFEYVCEQLKLKGNR